MTTPLPPAGWYPNPDPNGDGMRWWTGTTWTDAPPAVRSRMGWGRLLLIVGVCITLAGLVVGHLPSSHSAGDVSTQTNASTDPQATQPGQYGAPEPTGTEPAYTTADTARQQDKGWVLISDTPVVEDDNVSITARIRNANLDTETAVFTMTVLHGQQAIDTFRGTAQSVAPAQVVTVQLVSASASAHHEAKAGITSVEFQVDTSYPS